MGVIAKDTEKPVRVRYDKPRRISKVCKDTTLSRATVWRRIGDGSFDVAHVGKVVFIIGGPPGLFPDGQA
jgi:hypothetical protein